MARTELICPELWEEPMKIDLPFLSVGESLMLKFTIPSKGHIEGIFRVVGRLNVYDSKSGYTQRLKIEPKEG